MTLNKNQQATMKVAYEFMYADYRKEKRKRKPDEQRLDWLHDQLLSLQNIMYQLYPSTCNLRFERL